MKRVKRLFICLLTLLLISGCANKQEAKEGNVYYEIFVRSFYDSNNDTYGDLQGVITKLDYLDELGVSGLWLMPIMPSDTYHKYDVNDYYAIDSSYGTMEDFELLVSKANEKNIDIIIDLVLNHTSDTHPWFVAAKESLRNGTCDKENSYCDYYNFSEIKAGNYYAVPGTNYYYEAVFWEEMPDLNLDSPNVRKEIADIVAFWMNKGIKGFRLDAILHFFDGNTTKNVEFLTWFNDLVKSYREDAYIVGEAWSNRNTVLSYYESGISAFDFELSQSDGLIANCIRNHSGLKLAKNVADYNKDLKAYNPDGYNSVFISNHDQGRSAAYFAGKLEETKFMASVYLLMPGVPFIYYGEEIGLLGSGIDENKRLPFIWSDEDTTGMTSRVANADYTKRRYDALDVQMKDKESLYNHYQKTINVRNNYSVLIDGNVSLVDLNNESIYAISCSNDNDEIIVMHNFAEESVEVSLAGYELCDSIIVGNDKLLYDNNILKMPKYSSAVLRKK